MNALPRIDEFSVDELAALAWLYADNRRMQNRDTPLPRAKVPLTVTPLDNAPSNGALVMEVLRKGNRGSFSRQVQRFAIQPREKA